jgi:hypothetical protein
MGSWEIYRVILFVTAIWLTVKLGPVPKIPRFLGYVLTFILLFGGIDLFVMVVAGFIG